MRGIRPGNSLILEPLMISLMVRRESSSPSFSSSSFAAAAAAAFAGVWGVEAVGDDDGKTL